MQLKIDEVFAEKEIPANDSVRLLDQMIEEMDLTPLKRAYKRTGRRPATPPVTMFKIIVYAYMEGIYSSRKIASACARDMNFIWLLNGAKTPDHNEIARFRSVRMAGCAEELFYQFVRKLHEFGEIRYEHLFVDGTKMEANANKYSFVWKKSTTKYEERTLKKLEELSDKLCAEYGILTREALLCELKSRFTGEYVSGRGKRKTQLQRDIECLEELLSKKAKYAAYQSAFQGRNSFSKTDPDATFMHMKDDHMRNSQLKPGYNLQLGVEGEYITGILLSSERSDKQCLIPLLEGMAKHSIPPYRDVTADAGYESEENYSYFEGKPTECYIKPQNYEISKTRKFRNDMALRENMLYDAQKDEYTCKNGKKLRVLYTGKRRSKSGYESEVTCYECESCEGCPYKAQCTRAKGNRRIQVSGKFVEQRNRSLSRITSEKGILLRMNRSIQSEGAFGAIKQNHGFRQYLLRGNRKVLCETVLIALAYNVNKYHAKIQQNRTGYQLFQKLIA